MPLAGESVVARWWASCATCPVASHAASLTLPSASIVSLPLLLLPPGGGAPPLRRRTALHPWPPLLQSTPLLVPHNAVLQAAEAHEGAAAGNAMCCARRCARASARRLIVRLGVFTSSWRVIGGRVR